VALRAHLHLGPALERLRLPPTPMVVSAIAHAALFAALIVGASIWSDTRPKPVFVVLTPSTAAVGSPRGVSAPPPVETAPAPPRPAPELPQREAPRDLPARDMPARDLPARELPQRDSAGLPDRSQPTRAPALPRPSDKELPTVPSSTPSPPAPTPSAPARRETVASAPAPPPPLGSASGSATGVGPLNLSVSDFPYAWYIRQVHQKIQERWHGRAIPGQQPSVVFEIRRDGKLNVVVIDKSSGNAYYDQVALRAINDAGPFPPLPEDFKKPMLRIGLQFVFDPTGG
jgi:periplasmic protein TonB